jgi:hypothetical protein
MQVISQLHIPAALPPPPPGTPLSRRRCGLIPGLGAVEKNLFLLPWMEPRFLDRPTRSLVSVPTEKVWEKRTDECGFGRRRLYAYIGS